MMRLISIENDTLLPKIGVNRIHLLHIKSLSGAANYRFWVVSQFYFHFCYGCCVSDRDLDVRVLEANSTACLEKGKKNKQISKNLNLLWESRTYLFHRISIYLHFLLCTWLVQVLVCSYWHCKSPCYTPIFFGLWTLASWNFGWLMQAHQGASLCWYP